MRSDFGPVNVLSPRASHAVIAELRTHELSIDEIAVPRVRTERVRVQRVESLPNFLLVRRPRRGRRRPN